MTRDFIEGKLELICRLSDESEVSRHLDLVVFKLESKGLSN